MTKVEFTSDIDVELLKTDFADDWVCIAARTSTAGADVSDEANKGLINALMRDRHGSPFEHMNITFRVRAPLFVWREHHRHRIASYNEESARYKVLDGLFYVPAEDRNLVQTGKAMAYEVSRGTIGQTQLINNIIRINSVQAYERYENLLEAKIMREVARQVLPVNIMSVCIVTMNARALMNFLSLRVKSDDSTFKSNPQHEINMVADQYEKHFADYAPFTYEAFVKNGRVAP